MITKPKDLKPLGICWPDEAAWLLRVSRDTFDKLVKAGKLSYVQIGRRRAYLLETLQRFVRNQPDVAAA